MKVYTYTAERSLPRIALKGMPGDLYSQGFSFWDTAEEAASHTDEEDAGELLVVLEVDVKNLEDRFGVSGEDGTAIYEMIQDASGTEKADRWRDHLINAEGLKDYLALASGSVTNVGDIPVNRVTVLGRVDPKWEGEGEGEVKFQTAPKPLSKFRQPLVSRLLRSIFFPSPKLYGGAGPAVGLGRKTAPPPEHELELDLAARTIEGVELIFAAGKKFPRGFRARFGKEIGNAMVALIQETVEERVGKLLGSGTMGAVYDLPKSNRVLKLTMDVQELKAAEALLGVIHPNLSEVHEVFVVKANGQGVGVIIRSPIATTLDKVSRESAKIVNAIMGAAFEEVSIELSDTPDVTDLEEHATIIADQMENALEQLRIQACATGDDYLFDVSDALKMLIYMSVYGIDFDAENIGISAGPDRRALLFDFGRVVAPDLPILVYDLNEEAVLEEAA